MSATKKYSEKASAKVVQSTSTFSMNLPAASSAPALPATANSEPTLQDRLQTLAIASAAPAPTRPTTGRRLANPTATTLHNLLAQAVASRDAALLEQCLNVSDSAVVAATVRRLPAGEVAPLLDLLTARMQMRPARVERLVEWVRAVVVCHAAFLMTNPHLVANLGALHATLAERTATFEKMLKLGGRLDLVSSQIGLRAQRARFEDEDAEEKNGNGSGVAVYDEADEEDEDGMQEDGGDEFDDGDERMRRLTKMTIWMAKMTRIWTRNCVGVGL
ncbi:Dip2/Utp12 family-domain-containing protein [Chytriomyces sp. MP71]|nr:Dip2/Utp12 family-domain-containing protein [Chytriomyces sp. MP71]